MGALVATIVVEVLNVAVFGVMRIFEAVPAKSAPGSCSRLGSPSARPSARARREKTPARAILTNTIPI